MDFKVKGKEIEIIDPRTEHEDFVIFGVRACDARSFTILDKVFLADPVDTYYKSRREHGTIVSHGLHPSGGDLLLLQLSASILPAPEGDARCWMDEAKPVHGGDDREGREADRQPVRAAGQRAARTR